MRPPRSAGSPRAAGVARTVLYDHFPSKHALFVEVLDSSSRRCSYLSAALGSQGTTEDRWRAAFDAFFTFVEEQPLGWRLLFPSHPPLDPEAAQDYRRLRAVRRGRRVYLVQRALLTTTSISSCLICSRGNPPATPARADHRPHRV